MLVACVFEMICGLAAAVVATAAPSFLEMPSGFVKSISKSSLDAENKLRCSATPNVISNHAGAAWSPAVQERVAPAVCSTVLCSTCGSTGIRCVSAVQHLSGSQAVLASWWAQARPHTNHRRLRKRRGGWSSPPTKRSEARIPNHTNKKAYVFTQEMWGAIARTAASRSPDHPCEGQGTASSKVRRSRIGRVAPLSLAPVPLRRGGTAWKCMSTCRKERQFPTV